MLVALIIELAAIWIIPILAGDISIPAIITCIAIDVVTILPFMLVNSIIYNTIILPIKVNLQPYEEPQPIQHKQTLTLDDHSEEVKLAEQHLKEIEEWQAKKA